MNGFTHFDDRGNAYMVDVTDKDITRRTATAQGTIIDKRMLIKDVHLVEKTGGKSGDFRY